MGPLRSFSARIGSRLFAGALAALVVLQAGAAGADEAGGIPAILWTPRFEQQNFWPPGVEAARQTLRHELKQLDRPALEARMKNAVDRATAIIKTAASGKDIARVREALFDAKVSAIYLDQLALDRFGPYPANPYPNRSKVTNFVHEQLTLELARAKTYAEQGKPRKVNVSTQLARTFINHRWYDCLDPEWDINGLITWAKTPEAANLAVLEQIARNNSETASIIKSMARSTAKGAPKARRPAARPAARAKRTSR